VKIEKKLAAWLMRKGIAGTWPLLAREKEKIALTPKNQKIGEQWGRKLGAGKANSGRARKTLKGQKTGQFTVFKTLGFLLHQAQGTGPKKYGYPYLNRRSLKKKHEDQIPWGEGPPTGDHWKRGGFPPIS